MQIPNPIHPDQMTPILRRSEMCSIPTLGLARVGLHERVLQVA